MLDDGFQYFPINVKKRRIGVDDFTNTDLQLDGDRKLANFEFAVDHSRKNTKEYFPLEIIKNIRNACFPLFYGDDWLKKRSEIMRKYNLTENPKTGILIKAPRQCGKSVATAIGIGALMYAIPNIFIIIFSNSQNISNEMISNIKSAFFESGLKNIKCGKNRISYKFDANNASVAQALPNIASV